MKYFTQYRNTAESNMNLAAVQICDVWYSATWSGSLYISRNSSGNVWCSV